MSAERSDDIRIEITSPPDRNLPVANIMVDASELAEVSRDSRRRDESPTRIEIYPRADGMPWQLNAAELISAILGAEARLHEFLPSGEKRGVPSGAPRKRAEIREQALMWSSGRFIELYSELVKLPRREGAAVEAVALFIHDADAGRFVRMEIAEVGPSGIVSPEE